MPNFVQSQPQSIILLLVACVTLAVAAGVLFATTAITRRHPNVPFASMMPALMPMSAILGLLLAFLSGRVWENFDKAMDSVNGEVTAVNHIAAASRYLAPQARDQVLEGVAVHIRHATKEDWTQMSLGHGPIFTSSPGLALIREALVFPPQDDVGRMAQQFILSKLAEASVARTNRLRAGQYVIEPIVWATIVGLGFLVMCLIGLLTGASLVASATAVSFYALSFALTLTMLIAFDRPFMGGIEIPQAALRDLARHLEASRQAASPPH